MSATEPSDPLIQRRGLLLVLSSPSGAGKTTITRRLIARDPSLDLSVSVTTRRPRRSEINGRDYFFIDRDTFDSMVAKGDLLEHAIVFGNCYGTPRIPIEEALAEGRDIVTDIDWQGTQQLKESVRSDIVTVFVLPPNTETLATRLRTRAEDTEEEIVRRLSTSSDEMSHWPEYDYVVINDNLEQCISDVQGILSAERLRRSRRVGLAEFVNRVRESIAQRSAELLKRTSEATEAEK